MIKQLRRLFSNNFWTSNRECKYGLFLQNLFLSLIFHLPSWQLAILSGILIGLAYPPLHLGFLAWIGFVPLISIFLNESSSSVGKYSFLSAITANFISLYWIGLNSGAGFIPVFASLIGAILYLALFWTILGFLLSKIHSWTGKGLFVFPFLWVSMEWLRSFGPLGFPWINLALTQTSYLPLIQMADYGGSYGISFWIIFLNVIVFLIVTSSVKNRKMWILPFGLILSLWIIGSIRISLISNQTEELNFDVAVVQPNIDPNQKWERNHRQETFAVMHDLLNEATQLQPDLVLWPEVAVPSNLRLSLSDRRPIQNKVVASGIPLLSGTVDHTVNQNGEKEYYNGSIMMYPDGNIQMYHKVHLVPFAEYIPFSRYFPILKKLNFGQGNFSQGEEYTVFKVDSIQFSNIICYESSLPDIIREFIKRGAQFLSIQANDGWLGNSSGPYQHFELAKLRAVENRISVVRSANTGISGIILPTGRVMEKISIGERKVIHGDISFWNGTSFYTAFGDIFAMLCTIVICIVLGIGWFRHYLK